MCIKEVYYNTYADGKEDVTEMLYPCREGKVSHSPDVRKYERRLSFNKGDLDPEPRRPRSGSFYLGADLPTPRRSKSPSPAHRREPEPAVPDSPKATKHREYRDRNDHREARRRSLRLLEAELEKERARARAPSPPPPRKLKRTNTTPHVVVIEQGAPRFSSRHGLPDGPLHVAEEYIAAPRSSRDDDRDLRRRNSTKAKEYVIIDDERDRRRQTRQGKRRLSVSSSGRPDISLMTPPAEGDLRRGLRRSSTVVVPGASGSNAGSSGSSPPKHLRWEDQVRYARERHNDEIANRPAPPDGSRLKGILKPSGSPAKTKLARQESDLGGLRQAVENMDLPTGDGPGVDDDLKLYDRDRLLARFGGSETGSDRERRLRSKVWVSGDRFKYM